MACSAASRNDSGTSDPASSLLRTSTVTGAGCSTTEAFHRTVRSPELYEDCIIVVGPAFQIASGGDVTLRVGSRAVFLNGFSVLSGGKLTVEIDASLAN